METLCVLHFFGCLVSTLKTILWDTTFFLSINKSLCLKIKYPSQLERSIVKEHALKKDGKVF